MKNQKMNKKKKKTKKKNQNFPIFKQSKSYIICYKQKKAV